MLFRDVLRIASQNVWRGRARAALTALSVAIGVASVMLISSLGDSGCSVIEHELSKLGLSGITLYSASSDVLLTEDDVDTVSKLVANVEEAQPMIFDVGTYYIKNDQGNVLVWGVDSGIDHVMNIELLHGRLPNQSDVSQKKNVAVVDAELSESKYKRTNIVGKEIILTLGERTERFEIIGVIASQKDGINQMVGGVIPQFVYIPYTTLATLREDHTLTQIAIRCAPNSDAKTVGEQAVQTLSRINNNPDAYGSENMSGHISRLQGIAGLVALLISAIAAISLAVAGLGIMNTMLAATKERRHEIGIMMAIGAQKRDISMCFMAESAIIAGIGGLFGAGVGVLLSYLITNILGMPNIFSFEKLLIAETVSILCGIIFAVIPSRRAAALDPIVTLRE